MYRKAVFPGKYIQGAGAVGELPALLGSLGKRGLILASPSVTRTVLPASAIDWAGHGIGLGAADRERLLIASAAACATGQPVHHEAGIITASRVLDDLLAADALGQARNRCLA